MNHDPQCRLIKLMIGSSLACESRTRFAVRRIMSLPTNPATPRDYFPLASQK